MPNAYEKLQALGLRIKRLMLLYQIRSLEIQMHDTARAINEIDDADLAITLGIRRKQDSAELVRLRSEYNATLPAGQRRTWSMA